MEDAKYDALYRGNRSAAQQLFPGDVKKQQQFILQAAKDKAKGAVIGVGVVLVVTVAPTVAAHSARALLWAAANPEVTYTIGGAVGGLIYDGPEDIFPQTNGDEIGKYFKNLFRAPIKDIGSWLKFAGAENSNFIKGAKGLKTAIIGQGMGRVNKVASGIKDAVTFNPSASALDEWSSLLKSSGGTKLSDEVVKKTKLYKENVEWIGKVKKECYNIIDIGADNSGKQSTFYNMEKGSVYGEKK